MEMNSCDFWGITNHRQTRKGMPGIPEMGIPEHLQSYFLVFKTQVLKSEVFRKFWENMPYYEDRYDVIQNCETQLTRILNEAGFNYSVLFNTLNDSYPVSDSTTFSYDMLRKGLPLLKIKRLVDAENTDELITYIKNYTKYNTELISERLEKISLKIN